MEFGPSYPDAYPIIPNFGIYTLEEATYQQLIHSEKDTDSDVCRAYKNGSRTLAVSVSL
jgi:hypothetical protein